MTYVIPLKNFQNLPEAQNIFHCMEMRFLLGEKSANVDKITKLKFFFAYICLKRMK